jgi:DNA-directed RNA polymerase subunit RPC12/RpoP
VSINLTDEIFNDEHAAWKHFEAIRWPDGPECPHCGIVNAADPIIGKTARPGLYRCHECVKQFTATIGTIYEGSHIPMHKWVLATHLVCASKKGMSGPEPLGSGVVALVEQGFEGFEDEGLLFGRGLGHVGLLESG